jgi:folate-binding protein YgfZ
VTTGYQALQQNGAYVDLSGRGRLRITGEDRARLIHALTTNHIQHMKPGNQVYAFFLTAQGRIVSDSFISCYADYLLLDVPGEVRESISNHIDHYIIADDVTLDDVTETTFGLLAAGERIYGPIEEKESTIAALGLENATLNDLEEYRLTQFHPVFGKDFTSATLPQETGIPYALHFSKGCYIGQEIVERIRSRGHVNRVLAGLHSSAALPVGGKVQFNGEDVGQVTSSTTGSAIAMLRVVAVKPGTMVEVDGINAEVRAVS